ncbi:unnamed protein product [Soboliphyme baturini]|uniref:BPTI/Kunitz inhibitor domain-containing protein n=1 Tax=Soboliphyme baturini TaxID=241478 RepID=A0A183IG27_9BILA|nr:unnamed protein product [Soboliphyme baturini]
MEIRSASQTPSRDGISDGTHQDKVSLAWFSSVFKCEEDFASESSACNVESYKRYSHITDRTKYIFCDGPTKKYQVRSCQNVDGVQYVFDQKQRVCVFPNEKLNAPQLSGAIRLKAGRFCLETRDCPSSMDCREFRCRCTMGSIEINRYCYNESQICPDSSTTLTRSKEVTQCRNDTDCASQTGHVCRKHQLQEPVSICCPTRNQEVCWPWAPQLKNGVLVGCSPTASDSCDRGFSCEFDRSSFNHYCCLKRTSPEWTTTQTPPTTTLLYSLTLEPCYRAESYLINGQPLSCTPGSQDGCPDGYLCSLHKTINIGFCCGKPSRPFTEHEPESVINRPSFNDGCPPRMFALRNADEQVIECDIRQKKPCYNDAICQYNWIKQGFQCCSSERMFESPIPQTWPSSPAAVQTSVEKLCPRGEPAQRDSRMIRCDFTRNVCPASHECVSVSSGSMKASACCPKREFICKQQVHEGAYCPPERNVRPIVRYYFDFPSQRCRPFPFFGCDGNGNNFESIKECEEFCSGFDVPAVAMASVGMAAQLSLKASKTTVPLCFSPNSEVPSELIDQECEPGAVASCPIGHFCEKAINVEKHVCCRRRHAADYNGICPADKKPFIDLTTDKPQECNRPFNACPKNHECTFSDLRSKFFCCPSQSREAKAISAKTHCHYGNPLYYTNTDLPLSCSIFNDKCIDGYKCMPSLLNEEAFLCCPQEEKVIMLYESPLVSTQSQSAREEVRRGRRFIKLRGRQTHVWSNSYPQQIS